MNKTYVPDMLLAAVGIIGAIIWFLFWGTVKDLTDINVYTLSDLLFVLPSIVMLLVSIRLLLVTQTRNVT